MAYASPAYTDLTSRVDPINGGPTVTEGQEKASEEDGMDCMSGFRASGEPTLVVLSC